MKSSKTFPEFRKSIQVKARLSINDIDRLDDIIKKYQFKSRYQVVQYLIKCFLKVADPRPDEIVNKDIEEMFDGYDSVSRDDFQNVKGKYSI